MNRLQPTAVFALSVLIVPFAGGVEAGELTGRVITEASGTPSIVWIEGVSEGAMPERDTVITHLADGSFEPAVSVGFVGNAYVFRNQDDELHTTHLYLRLAGHDAVSGRPLVNGATIYNIALPRTGMEVQRPILDYHAYGEKTGAIEVKCNLHPDERAHLLVFSHPYATLTGDEGEYAIDDVPAGKHDVWVWHDGTARKMKTVEFAEGRSVEEVFEIEDAR